MGSSKYRTLKPSDLTGFSKEATKLVMQAMEAGCTAKISNKHHCILRNDAGRTASVPRNLSSANRSAQNSAAEIRRLIAGQNPHPSSTGAAAESIEETMTVKDGLLRHATAVSRWLGEQDGVPPTARIRISGKSDDPTVELIDMPDPAPAPAPVDPTLTSATVNTGPKDSKESQELSTQTYEANGPEIIEAEFARRLRTARNEHQLTQAQLAAHMGVSIPTLIRIEKCQRAPRLGAAVLAADALDIPLPQLIGVCDQDAVQSAPATRSADCCNDSEVLAQIRSLLGEDPQLEKLRTRVRELTDSLSEANQTIEALRAERNDALAREEKALSAVESVYDALTATRS